MVDQVMAARFAQHCADAQRVAQALHGDLEALRAERARAERVVASLDEQIAAIEQLAGVITMVKPLHDNGFVSGLSLSNMDENAVPEQRMPDGGVATASDQTTAAEGMGRRSTYREQVLSLLAQDPLRWWKAREIAEALRVENVRSLREALRGMAERGLLDYESDSLYGARYRAVSKPDPVDGGLVFA